MFLYVSVCTQVYANAYIQPRTFHSFRSFRILLLLVTFLNQQHQQWSHSSYCISPVQDLFNDRNLVFLLTILVEGFGSHYILFRLRTEMYHSIFYIRGCSCIHSIIPFCYFTTHIQFHDGHFEAWRIYVQLEWVVLAQVVQFIPLYDSIAKLSFLATFFFYFHHPAPIAISHKVDHTNIIVRHFCDQNEFSWNSNLKDYIFIILINIKCVGVRFNCNHNHDSWWSYPSVRDTMNKFTYITKSSMNVWCAHTVHTI